jgi:hypothetical protein
VKDPRGDGSWPGLGQVEQPGQGIGVGDGQVIRGQDPDLGSAVQGIRQPAVDLPQAGLHHEADQQVHAVEPRIAQAAQQLITQQPILPVDQRVLERRVTVGHPAPSS